MERMTCDRFREQAAVYSAGWMDEAERSAWEAHRDACPACAAEAVRDARLVNILDAVSAVEPAPVSWTDLLHQRQPTRRRWAPAFAGAVATVALVAGSFHFWQGPNVSPVANGSDTAAYVRVHSEMSAAEGMGDPNTMVLLAAAREGNG